MTEAAYNLLTITGHKKDLDKLEKTAYKNDSEAFHVENFINYRGNSTTPNQAVFSTNWVAFGILIEKTENSLKYFFNSEWNAVNLRYIVDRFPDLDFKQVYVEIPTEKIGIIHYNTLVKLEQTDSFEYWDNPCYPHTYLFMEDVALKLEYLLSVGKTKVPGQHFFQEVNKTEFLKNRHSEYERIINQTINLEKHDLYYARYGIFYSLISAHQENLEQFIRDYIQTEKQDKFLDQLNETSYAFSKERRWWNCLSHPWKVLLLECLVYYNPDMKNGETDEEAYDRIIKSIKSSDRYLSHIVNLESLVLPLQFLFDNLKMTLGMLPKLTNIHLDFDGVESFSTPISASFENIIEFLPTEVFSKVSVISMNVLRLDDVSSLSKFPNLKEFYGQCTFIHTLDGIEKCKNLRSFTADQGNYYTNLEPLSSLQLEHLNIQFAGSSFFESTGSLIDLSPLKEIKSLKSLYTEGCNIEDYSVLLDLPNLIYLETGNSEEIVGETNAEFKSKLKDYLKAWYTIL